MADTSRYPDNPDTAATATRPLPVLEPAPAGIGRAAATRNRPGLHLALLLATFYTMTLAGVWAATGQLTVVPSAVGLPYSLCLIAILGAHELGHYYYCRRYGVDASLPYFLPGIPLLGTFGAFIRIRAPFPNRNVLFDVGVAGPLAGFAVALPVLVYGFLHPTLIPADQAGGGVGEPLLFTLLDNWLSPEVPDGHVPLLSGALMAGWVGCLATAMNLLPIGQLDGGHICYAFSNAFHRHASLVGIAAFVAMGLLVSPSWLAFATILVFIGPRHPPVVDETIELSGGRRLIGMLALLVLILCFIPRPLP